jgi:uncharacterized membrane-anchored protein YhcB (DUF1043 family)
MFDINLFIGVMVGLLIGAVGMWALDRRHQRITKKLVESRRKIERQRTQAVNDLFALRAEMEDPKFRAQHQQPLDPVVSTGPDPKTAAELANLRSLIARADGALTAARRKRDEHEREIARLRTVLEDRLDAADVIDLRRSESAGGLAL